MAHKKASSIEFDGLEQFEDALADLGYRVTGIEKYTLYSFSDVIADAVQDEIAGLPTMTEKERLATIRKGGKIDPTPEQKEGLISGMRGGSSGHFGITQHKIGDRLNAYDYVTFAGYNKRKSSGYFNNIRDIHGQNRRLNDDYIEYPNGEPNIAVADWVNAGTKRYKAHHFTQNALNAAFDKARDAGIEAMDDIINRIINENMNK